MKMQGYIQSCMSQFGRLIPTKDKLPKSEKQRIVCKRCTCMYEATETGDKLCPNCASAPMKANIG